MEDDRNAPVTRWLCIVVRNRIQVLQNLELLVCDLAYVNEDIADDTQDFVRVGDHTFWEMCGHVVDNLPKKPLHHSKSSLAF